ncbi:MAG: glycoside hydrolase family 127 protein, partial [Clostridia bacterium]|nr:glycoside hydrolase family 127 protein [Clostridia bacterium]
MKLTRNILAILLLLTTMLSLCAPSFALSASAASATSAPQAGEYYRLKNKKTQTYLTETEDTTFDPPYDTRRIVLDEKRSSDTQLFTISSASEGVDRFEFLISLSTGKALHRTARSDTRIANANCVITFTYSPGYIEERWYIQEAEDGYYRILSRDSVARGPVSQYLTATEFKNPVYEDKTDLTAAPLTDDDSQLWYFEKETVEADKNDVQPLPGYPLYDITPAEVLKPYLYTRIAAGDAKIGGYVGEALDFIYQEQVLAIDWKMLVNQFRYQTDNASTGWQQWKTEFFGKLMRGATWYYNYTGDEALYEELTAAVMDLLSTQEENGRISGYPIDGEFVVHDIWCRKYTMLGLQYYYDICKDEDMKAYVLRCLSIHADYILTKIGPEADQISILAGELEGLSATSILEPFVKLYKMTGYQRYLDFATYIVESGGYTRGNIFEAAYEGTLSPYQYTTSPHGYAMSSCFAGLAEYYSVTGEEKWLIALVNYVNAIIRDEVTVVGSGGASGPPMNWSPEWWNNTAVQQANPSLVQMQETCTTAAWMQLLEKVLAFTEDSKLMDELEKSLYNALLGAMQGEDAEVEGACASLCWDYFSPLYGTRNNDFPGHIHGVDSCCNANGLTGLSMIPFLSVMNGPLGPVVNLYNEAVIKANTPSGKKVTLRFDTEYPIKGDIAITLSLESAETFTVMLRIPSYSKTTVVKVNGVTVQNVVSGEYLAIERSWKNGDTVELVMDMNTYVVECADGTATDAGEYIALVRGPITLARDARFNDGYILDGSGIKIDEKGCANVILSETQSFRNHMEFLVETEDGSTIRMTDYASAGSTWTKESLYATWLLSEAPPTLSENTEYRIICRADSALLTATTGDNVNREAASEGTKQTWTLEKSGEGFYIKNAESGKYLSAAGNESK